MGQHQGVFIVAGSQNEVAKSKVKGPGKVKGSARPKGVFIIREKCPVVLDEASRVSTACFISSVMGDCSGVTFKQETATSPDAYPWEVFWDVASKPGYGNTGDLVGVWLSQHGVYVSDGIGTRDLYQIVGYCAYQKIPFFTDDSMLSLA